MFTSQSEISWTKIAQTQFSTEKLAKHKTSVSASASEPFDLGNHSQSGIEGAL
jgi:hypothetical protein